MFWLTRKKIAQAVQKVVQPKPQMNDEELAYALKIIDVYNKIQSEKDAKSPIEKMLDY